MFQPPLRLQTSIATSILVMSSAYSPSPVSLDAAYWRLRPSLEAKLQRLAPANSRTHALGTFITTALTTLAHVPEPALLLATFAGLGALLRVLGVQGMCPTWLAHSAAWSAMLLAQFVNGLDCYPFKV